MWFLKNVQNGTIYYVRPAIAKHTVSRSTGELIIQGDPSISRNHAFLYPEPHSLKIVDAGSRYGTFVNEFIDSEREQIAKDVPTELRDGDRVRFGKCQSVWVVGRQEFRCITSTVGVTGQLKDWLGKLGGVVQDNFGEGKTDFLIMKTITTTPKLLMCLIGQIPVVVPQYFEESVKAVERGKELPNVDEFIPEFTEAYVRSEGMTFKKVPGRKTLFAGKTFVFIKPKHMSQYEAIIKLAGGSCVCAQKRKIAKSYFTEPNVIVMQATNDSLSQASSQAIDGLTQIVSSAGRRMIPDAEIGLAVLLCSMEKYCNPLYKFTNVLDLDTVPLSIGEALAKNSEDQPGPSKSTSPRESISIPETESRDSSEHVDIHKSLTAESMDYGDQMLRVSEAGQKFVKPKDKSPALSNAKGSKRKRPQEPRADSPKKEEPVKKVRSEPIEKVPTPEPPSQIEIAETPASNGSASQASQFAGFLSVNHDAAAEEEEAAATQQRQQKQKRPLNLMLDDGDDDLFNFDEALPKRPKKQQTLAESFGASQTSQRSKTSTKSDRNPDGEEDLFSFDSGSSKRARNKTVPTKRPESSPSTSTTASTTTTTTNSSSSYKQFIKPIQIPLDGWLTSTFCDLKIKSQDDEVADADSNEFHDSTVPKVKQEPGDDEDQKTRVWIDGMKAMFQVRVKCMNLTSHRPCRSGDNSSFFSNGGSGGASLNGGSNFKAFVKKQNYKPQQTVVKTKPICVIDNTQDDNF